MWNKSRSYRKPNTFNNRRFRPVKAVPKKVILAAIASSQQSARTVQPDIKPKISRGFEVLTLDERLKDNIKSKGFDLMTPIQDRVIPAILDNHDVIGMAATGTGKTAAFLIPLIQKVLTDRAQRVLVIIPTRELAFQINNELRDFARGLSIKSAVVVGGMSEWRQIQDLQRDPHFVIATPGRLKEFIQIRKIRLSGFRNVVLDEADRMVDIGFINEIKFFISQLPQKRRSLFFSATISANIEQIIADFVTDAVRVSESSRSSAAIIHQEAVYVTDEKSKIDILFDLLKQKEFDKVLAFGRTKYGVQRLSDQLAKRGVKAGAIHGDKRQNQRRFVLEQFSRNEIQILLATDVASRGLDIPNVSHVINYDLPETMDDYIHRIGRTGRANHQGTALTFIE